VQMRAEIIKLHKKLDTTIIYVTHDQVEAMTMADKMVVMKDGLIHQIDSPLKIYNEPVNLFVAGFVGSPAINQIRGTIVEEKDKLKPTSVDLHLDLAVGEIFLKHESIPPRSVQRGKPKHPKGPGWRDLKIGYQIITLLLDIMKTGPNLYRLESPNYMQARLSRLRRFLGEKPSKNYNPILDVRSVPDYTAKCKCTWQLIELLSEVQSPEESQLA